MVLGKNFKRVQWKLFGMGMRLCFPRGFPSAFCCQVCAGLYFKNVTKKRRTWCCDWHKNKGYMA
jgi:hypothetical protein